MRDDAAPRGRFFRGDALDALGTLDAGSASLVYLDPPFFVDRPFRARPPTGDDEGGPRERSRGAVAYDDTWPSRDAYLAWLVPRIEAAFAALTPTGTLWVHLDHHAVRDVEGHLATRLGREAFAGEIVWVPGNGAKARRGVPRAHQTLLVYAKSPKYTWNLRAPEAREPFAETSLSMHFGRVDEGGRAYRNRTVGKKTYRYYADEGRAVGSVWTDCPAMLANTPLRGEGTGYPTQKPEKLLARIVALATHPGELVVDPFAGSGTTLVVAHRLGRRYFGSDVGALAQTTTLERLAAAGARPEVLGGPPRA